jgi:hypothetical protein
VISRNAQKYALAQRIESDNADGQLAAKLGQQGVTVIQADAQSFRAKCGPHWAWARETYGDAAWATLERATGQRLS